LDLIQNAGVTSGIDQVKITTRKPAQVFDEENLSKDKTIFKGSANLAIENYPKNINVAIILSLAGIGTTDTEVEIVAAPTLNENEINIEVSGDVEDMNTTMTNNPML